MTSRVLVQGLLVLALATGCSSADTTEESGSEGPSTSVSPTPVESDPGSPTPEVPEVEPATGERLTVATVERDVFGFNLPEGEWRLTSSGRIGVLETPAGSWNITGGAVDGADGVSLDFLARGERQDFIGLGPKPQRRDDRVVDGIEGYVLEAGGRDGLYYQFGSVLGDNWVTVTFEFTEDSPETRGVIESVLASAAWQ
ncbi:hypothetical protein [Nocardioides sp.]|uniref:hypothetical protein n=1 Tax=Nocardioides sp. TaxID=35761 RepID=UPI0023A453E1|nr:hypothetical protein [Nocardioides sp.]MDE0778688.1 hypothetical protein [Nocardioides sp.]